MADLPFYIFRGRSHITQSEEGGGVPNGLDYGQLRWGGGGGGGVKIAKILIT